MPPKFRFTKEEITDAAVVLVREKGMESLTARELASRLGASAKPIFGQFGSMREVRASVIARASQIQSEFFAKGISEGKYPPYKAIGIAYIRFAEKEKELFKLLYMRDRTDEAEEAEDISEIIGLIMKNTELDEEKARRLHGEMWIFVHGIAVMTATNYLKWSEDIVSAAITDVYEGVKNRLIAKKAEEDKQSEENDGRR